jgi:hypothetical protein
MLRLTEACLLELYVVVAEVARLGRAARRISFRHQKDDGALLGEQILHAHFLVLSFRQGISTTPAKQAYVLVLQRDGAIHGVSDLEHVGGGFGGRRFRSGGFHF